MAMAASISLYRISPVRHSFVFAKACESSGELKPFNSPATLRSPAVRISVSSMTVEAPEKISKHSFLDRRESGFLHFVKYHGLGNDFILVDNRDSLEPKVIPEHAVKLCDLNSGVVTDEVVFVMPGTIRTDYSMRIFNSDGSEPEMCGNGVRCFARFIAELTIEKGKHSLTAETDLKCWFSVFYGTTVHTGAGLIVPQIQTHGKNLQVDELNLAGIGPNLSIMKCYLLELIQTHLKMHVWERGGGATLACGTGALAVMVAAVLEDHSERSCMVDLPGGPLEIQWNEKDNHVYTSGPAEVVFYGSVPL